MRNLFVYGSLKKGFYNHSLLEDSLCLTKNACTLTKFTMVDLGSYPAIFLIEGSTRISGELYSVSDETYKNIERLEGYPNYYSRATLPIVKNSGTDAEETILAETYYLHTMDDCKYKVVPEGIWKKTSCIF